MRRDSKTIPSVIMADIWMRIRHKLRPQAGALVVEEPGPGGEGDEDAD